MSRTNDSLGGATLVDSPSSTPGQESGYDFLTTPCTSVYHQGLEASLKGLPLEGSEDQEFLDGYFSLGGNEVTANPIATLEAAWL